eukprot:s2564_g1.t1
MPGDVQTQKDTVESVENLSNMVATGNGFGQENLDGLDRPSQISSRIVPWIERSDKSLPTFALSTTFNQERTRNSSRVCKSFFFSWKSQQDITSLPPEPDSHKFKTCD